MDDIVKQAKQFAKDMHSGQTRFDGSPYIKHPLRVSALIKRFKGKSKNIKALEAAAILHDTVEDTEASIKVIREKFGNMISSIVRELTSDSDKIKLIGKAEYLKVKMVNDLTDYALVIKLADRLDNILDMSSASETFVNKYTKETDEIINYIEENRNLTGTQKKIVEAIKSVLNKYKKQ